MNINSKGESRAIPVAVATGETRCQNKLTTKNTISLLFMASTLILAGCCTTPHVTKWEYKVTVAPPAPRTASSSDTAPNGSTNLDNRIQEHFLRVRENQQAYLDELGKDGWVLIAENDGVFYLKRPIK